MCHILIPTVDKQILCPHFREDLKLFQTHSSVGQHNGVTIAITVWQIPDAVDTVVCAPDDGWWYRPKHVEQFPDKINRVILHLVGYILEYYYDARTHERKKRQITIRCTDHSVSVRPYGAYILEGASRFLENLWTQSYAIFGFHFVKMWRRNICSSNCENNI